MGSVRYKLLKFQFMIVVIESEIMPRMGDNCIQVLILSLNSCKLPGEPVRLSA